jgi:hypothetical protein
MTTPAMSDASSFFLPSKPRNPGASITAARSGLTRAIQKQAAKDSARARPVTPAQKDVQFRVQICQHEASSGWDWEEDCLTLGVTPGIGYTLPGFIEHLLGEAQLTTTQVLTHLHPAVTRTGPGEWSLAVNHITATNKKPRYFRLWPGVATIDKILRTQQYNKPTNGAFNCSLIWKVLETADVPEDDAPIENEALLENDADGDSDIHSLNTLSTDHTFLKKLGAPRPIPPPEDPAVNIARLLADHRADAEETAKLAEMRARYNALLRERDLHEEPDHACHKRKISAAIPANERPNADGDVVVAGEADEADKADETAITAARGNESQAGGSAARGDDTPTVRRSSRQRRPKQLD